MAKKLVGIRSHGRGWQAYVRIAGRLYTEGFALDTPVSEMQRWRETQIGRVGATERPPLAGSLAADVQAALSCWTSKRVYKQGQRQAHLAIWVAALGGARSRASVTPAEIERIMQGWLAEGLSAGTVRKRRGSLMALYVQLEGKHSRTNPVRGTRCPSEAKPEARGLAYATIERIIEAMPLERSHKPGTIAPRSLARIRVAVLAYTGIPPETLMHVRPADLDLEAGTVRASSREKGAGVEPRTLPLTREGIEAFRAFHQAQAYGRFAVESVNRAFKKAAGRIGLNPAAVHLYDLRHSFGTELYRVTRDLATVARFLLHAEGSPITARYAKAAHRDVDVAAAAQLEAAFAAARQAAATSAGRPPVAKLPVRVASAKKSRRMKHLRVVV